MQTTVLHRTEQRVLDLINLGAPQVVVSDALAIALREVSEEGSFIDWITINRAMLQRWKPSGREFVRRRAFKIFNGERKLKALFRED
jgi:hypothetical protein